MELKPMHLPIELVLNVVTQSLPKYANVTLAPSHPITRTLLSFTLVCRETYRLASRYLLEHCVHLSGDARARSFLSLLLSKTKARKIPSMLFAQYGDPIGDLPTATWIYELFNYTAPTLRRLIIDIPLRKQSEWDDPSSMRRLYQGFLCLENLEEFVSTQNAGYLDTFGNLTAAGGFSLVVWRNWRKLKRLALYGADTSLQFWQTVAEVAQLETLVLTRASGLREHNIKIEYCRHTSRPLKLLLVDVEGDQVRFGNMRRIGWNTVDPEKRMTIMTYNVPILYSHEDPGEVCQAYVRSGAENGTLWDWEGEVMQHLLPLPTAI